MHWRQAGIIELTHRLLMTRADVGQGLHRFVDGGKKPAARAGRSGGETVDDFPPAEGALPPASPAGAGLLLRDDPGLDVRAE